MQLVWGLFAAFVTLTLLLTISSFIVEPIMFGVANVTQNKTFQVLPWSSDDSLKVENARATAQNGWLAVGYGFPILSLAVIIRYALDKQGEKREEEELNEVPEFSSG